MKGILGIGVLVLCFSTINAQQDPMYSQYIWNPLSVNAAYAGNQDALSIALIAREQWVGVEGRPRTQSLTMHTPLKNKSYGLGLSIINDEIGPVKDFNLNVDFAYRMKVKKGHWLSLGLKGGMSLWNASLSNVGNDLDPAFEQDVKSAFIPNFGFGAHYSFDKYEVSVAVPRLLESELGSQEVSFEQGDLTRHYFMMAGASFPLNREMVFKPMIQVKHTKGAPTNIAIAPNMQYKDFMWLGLSYRTSNDISAMFAFKITEQLKAGYAYDFTASSLGSYQQGSHEIMLTYDFFYTKQGIISPRFFF